MLFLGKHCRVLYNAHGWAFFRDTAEWKRKIYALIERMLLQVTDAVINVSNYEYKAALRYGVPPKKQYVIYSGISVEKEPLDLSIQFSNDTINLLFVGRFDPQKGVDYLLRFFKKCQRKNIHLYLIGDNVIGGSHIEKENSDRLTFLGWVPHEKVGSYYAASDAVIMPSRWEAFGLVAVEAMKYGKTVITSNRGVLPEIIKDGENGCVFDFDNPQTLKAILCKLNKPELQKIGSEGKK